MRPIESFCT